MPTTVAITNANGTAWTFATGDTPSNPALAGRMHDLGFLAQGSATPFGIARAGVLPSAGAGASASVAAGFFCSPTGSGLTVQVGAGGAAVERGTFSGAGWSTFTPAGTYPYLVALKSSVTFTANTANSLSGSRIDRVDLQIMDGPGYADNGGTSLAQIIYTAGTVGAGVAANAPANSVPLCLITFPSGTTTTLTSGMFTDIRRSAGIGADRILLPGDALADAGFMVGETRWRYSTSYAKWLMDVWDPVASGWKGTESLNFTAGTWQNGTANIAISNSARTNLVIVSIPDPGFPYTVQAAAQIDWNQYGTFTAGAPPYTQAFATIDTNAGTMLAQSLAWAGDASNTFDAITPLPMSPRSGTLTGAHSVVLSGLGKVAVNCPYTGFTAGATYLSVIVNPV